MAPISCKILRDHYRLYKKFKLLDDDMVYFLIVYAHRVDLPNAFRRGLIESNG